MSTESAALDPQLMGGSKSGDIDMCGIQVTGTASPMLGAGGRPTAALRNPTSKCSESRRCRMGTYPVYYLRKTGTFCYAYRWVFLTCQSYSRTVVLLWTERDCSQPLFCKNAGWAWARELDTHSGRETAASSAERPARCRPSLRRRSAQHCW